MPIPAFRDDGWLPEGHHEATWDEVVSRFGDSVGSRRESLMQQLLGWRDALRAKGVTGRLILNGSFISGKETPGDFDALLVYDGRAEDVFRNDEEARLLVSSTRCKEAGFDLFVFSAAAVHKFPEFVHLDAFDYDKRTGTAKGVVEVTL